MKKFLPILLLLLCSACASTHRDASPAPVGNSADDEMNDVAIYAVSMAETPYRYGGDSPAEGFDCSGFVHYVFQQALGWQLPRTSLEMSRKGEPLSEYQLRPGDLVFFNTQHRPFSHVGIYVGNGRFVHAPKTGKSVSIANMQGNYWRSRYEGARRIDLRGRHPVPDAALR